MTTESREAMRILRERLIADSEKKTYTDKPKTGGGGDNARYPFWQMDPDKTATIRLLPDHESSKNPWFWMPREVIKLPFSGVVGGEYPTNKSVTVEVPCVDMFAGMTCPIIAETRPWWKDESKKDLARVYYKKKSWLFQGFVTSSPFEEAELPENPIRRFTINASIFKIIQASLKDPDMEDMPVDYVGGTDFRITKTKKGDYANYDLSGWSRRSRPLSENEMIAIQQFGLFNLKDFLGRVPDSDELAAIKALFHSSLAGDPFDADSYGQYFRAYTDRNDEEGGASSNAPTPRSEPSKAAERHVAAQVAASTPETAPAAASGKPNAKDILARIAERTASAKA